MPKSLLLKAYVIYPTSHSQLPDSAHLTSSLISSFCLHILFSPSWPGMLAVPSAWKALPLQSQEETHLPTSIRSLFKFPLLRQDFSGHPRASHTPPPGSAYMSPSYILSVFYTHCFVGWLSSFSTTWAPWDQGIIETSFISCCILAPRTRLGI